MKQSSKSKSSTAVALVAIDVAAASLVVASKREGQSEAVATYGLPPKKWTLRAQ